MSAEQRRLLSPGAPFPPAAVEALGGVEPHSSPHTEMDTLRMFVHERLTAAVDDILGVFVKTVARYREQIEHQRRQLDSLRSEESRWSRAAGRSVSRYSDGRVVFISNEQKTAPCVSGAKIMLLSNKPARS